MKNPERKEDEAKKSEPPAPAAKPPAQPADPAAPKPKYVFKIVPADPKNSLDFEDTADK